MARLVNEPYIERASPQSLKVILWRKYRCDNEVGTLPKANYPARRRDTEFVSRDRNTAGRQLANHEARSAERWAIKLVILLEIGPNFVITPHTLWIFACVRVNRPCARPRTERCEGLLSCITFKKKKKRKRKTGDNPSLSWLYSFGKYMVKWL